MDTFKLASFPEKSRLNNLVFRPNLLFSGSVFKGTSPSLLGDKKVSIISVTLLWKMRLRILRLYLYIIATLFFTSLVYLFKTSYHTLKNSNLNDQIQSSTANKDKVLPFVKKQTRKVILTDLYQRIKNDSSHQDLFITIKTTKKYHRSRVDLLIATWISLLKQSV